MNWLTESVLAALLGLAAATSAAEEAPKGGEFAINQGIAGTWFNPQTVGQGFLIDIEPADEFIFIAWFTFEAMATKVGTPGQRWLTAQGNYAGASAEIPIFVTAGGAFDSGQSTSTEQVGTLSVAFDSCTSATVSYSLDEGLANEFQITRLIPMSEALCESL